MDFLPPILNQPWKTRTIACLLGVMGSLAFAPFFLFPALILSLSGLWVLLDRMIEARSSFRSLFLLGWWFGLGHFTGGLYWIAHALTVDLETFWWALPFALLGIPSLLAIFIGFSFMVLRLWPFGGISRAFVFSALWVSVEWIRTYLFTGFPWNLLGYAWRFSLEIMQVASLVGVYGLSLLILLMSVTLGYLAGKKGFERNVSLFIYLLIVVCWIWGHNRLNHPDVTNSPSLSLRIVQPNIAQTLKWDPKQQDENFHRLLSMTKKTSPLPLRFIIWPESAVPFFLEQNVPRRDLIADFLPKGAFLLTGALRKTVSEKDQSPQVWNSLLVLNTKGDIIGHYDKAHLVPFGEYLPFRSFLDSLFGKGAIKKLTAGTIDFSAGPGPETVPLPEGLPSFSALICYEAIFPRTVTNPDQPRPDWVINITNDAWFGNTSGPYQHLEIARFRAIEEGIPLVRVANSGISAVFNAYGRLTGSIGLEERGVLDTFLPAPTRLIPFYGRWGDWTFMALLICTFAFAFVFGFKRHHHERLYLYK